MGCHKVLRVGYRWSSLLTNQVDCHSFTGGYRWSGLLVDDVDSRFSG